MPLPSFAVTGSLFNILGTDTSELSATTLNGTVTFTPNVPTNSFVTWEDHLYRVSPIKARITGSGITYNGEPLLLLANDPGLSVTGLQWHVEIEVKPDPGTGITRTMKDFWFNAPTDGATVDLADVTPTTNTTAQGVAFTEAQLVALLSDAGSGVREALDALYTGGGGSASWSTLTGKPAVIAAGADQSAARTAIGALSSAEISTLITTATNNLLNGAPGALDTLKELADAINDDANFAATMTAALAAKAPLASPTFTGTVSGVSKAMVGLGNVDNTSDTSKPISTAQAAVNTSTLRRPVRNTIAALGDSITAWGDGNYYYQGYVSDVYLNHLSLETHQRIKYWGHYAKGGVSLTYMRDTLLPLLLANNPLPGACVIFGGTNDISGVGTLADSRTYSLSYSTGVLKNIINSLLTVGIVPILCTLPPRGDQPALNPTIITWNTWVRRYAAANGFPLIDVYAGVAGSDGSWASAAYTLDGEHPSMQGHRVISQQAIANGLPEIFPPNRPATSRSTADLTNLFNNGTINLGLFTTNASGVGTGLSYAGTGTASIVAPVTSDNLMGNWQQIARATGNTGTAFASKTFSAGWSVGDVIAFSCRVQTSGIDTTLTPFSVYMTQAVPGGFTTPNGVSLTFLPEGLNSWTSDVDGLVYREFTIVAGCTTLGFTMQMSAVPNAGTPWLRVGELTVYNLTTGGQLV